MEKTQFVLYTSDEKYVVEYLLKQLILSTNLSEALTFQTNSSAQAFKNLLEIECNLNCSVNTYIE